MEVDWSLVNVVSAWVFFFFLTGRVTKLKVEGWATFHCCSISLYNHWKRKGNQRLDKDRHG